MYLPFDQGSDCGTVGWVIASNNRDPQFNSHNQLNISKLTSSFAEKMKMEQNGPS